MKKVCLLVGCLILVSSMSFANMKKGRVGGGGTKGFAFSTFSDGFCTISTIYDTASSYLGVALGLPTGDLVCAGLSSQNNFQSCSAGLPGGTYVFIVTSIRGPSNFRVVVNCSDQQSVVAGRTSSGGTEIREIDLDANGKKLIKQLNSIAEKTGVKP
jgi:hypothetical protein